MKYPLMAEEGLQLWRWPGSSHMLAEKKVSRFCFYSLFFHCSLFTKSEEAQKSLSKTKCKKLGDMDYLDK